MFDVKPITSPKQLDCGPTCLKMLLAYYGIDVDLDTLIKECNVSYAGCTAADIMRAGRKHGLDMMAWGNKDDFNPSGSGETIEVDTIEYDRPAIVWWKYNHFVVFCGLNDDGKVVICNPDRGRYPISKSLFKSFNSGVDITNGIPQKQPEEGDA